MEFKDLYLKHSETLENFAFDKNELEMFTMAMLYGNDLSKMPYDFIKEKGLYKAKNTFNKVQKALTTPKELQQIICDLISDKGKLELFDKKSFDVLSNYFRIGQWTLKNFLNNLTLNEDEKIEVDSTRRFDKVLADRDIYEDGYHANSYYAKDHIKVHRNREERFSYSGLWFYNSDRKGGDFLCDKNPLFDELFVEWIELSLNDEDQQKLKNWEERMEKYEEVKDMVDHAPEKPWLNYQLHVYIKPTKFYLELKELYKKEIKKEETLENEKQS